MTEVKTGTKAEYFFKGIPVAPGVAIDKAFVLTGESVKFRAKHVKAKDVKKEIADFQQALDETKAELKEVMTSAMSRVGNDSAKIFETHSLFLEDPYLVDETITSIKEEKLSSDYAFYHIIQK